MWKKKYWLDLSSHNTKLPLLITGVITTSMNVLITKIKINMNGKIKFIMRTSNKYWSKKCLWTYKLCWYWYWACRRIMLIQVYFFLIWLMFLHHISLLIPLPLLGWKHLTAAEHCWWIYVVIWGGRSRSDAIQYPQATFQWLQAHLFPIILTLSRYSI